MNPRTRHLVLPVLLGLLIASGARGTDPPVVVSTLAGTGIQAFGGDGGPAAAASLSSPWGMAADSSGDLYFADYYNHRVRRIDARTGRIETVAGTGRQGDSGEAGPALAMDLNGPYGVAIDSLDRVLFTDHFSHRIRRLDPRTGWLETVAGTGEPGPDGDGGPATSARLVLPLDVAVAADGTIAFSCYPRGLVRRIDPASGNVTTVAGTGAIGDSGDGGPATEARLDQPHGLAFDREGNLFVADHANHRVRRVDAATGHITTVVGTGEPGFSGDGEPAHLARISRPYGLAFAPDGALVFADSGNDRVRRLDPATGFVSTIAGAGASGEDRDGLDPLATRFRGPFGVAYDAGGNLLVAEYIGHRIRRVVASEARPATTAERPPLSVLARSIFAPLPPAPETSPAKTALGLALFHDPQLSRQGDVACATCHPIGRYGADGRRTPEGTGGAAVDRNVPSLFHASAKEALFWDGRARDLPTQIRSVLLEGAEMAVGAPEEIERRLAGRTDLAPLVAEAFPSATDASFDQVVAALTAFVSTLHSPAPFDRWLGGDLEALGPAAERGLGLFLENGCAACHSGPLLGGRVLRLRSRYPTPAPIRFLDRLGDRFTFVAPSLRNVAVTGPWLHDGSAATLEEAISDQLASYGYAFRPEETQPHLDPGQRADLVAFLGSLTGRTPGAAANGRPTVAGGHGPGERPRAGETGR